MKRHKVGAAGAVVADLLPTILFRNFEAYIN